MGDGDFQTLVAFEIEVYGQDQNATGHTSKGNKKRILTQYKFSLSQRQIQPKELTEIAAALQQSEVLANAIEDLPTERILRTNRPLSPRAQASPALREMKYSHYDALGVKRDLEDYAARFGISGAEKLGNCVRRLIGYLADIGASAGPHQIARGEFDAQFAGFDNPRSLAIHDACGERTRELNEQKSINLDLDGLAIAARLPVSQAMERLQNDAIVLITGNGGCGKTTSLWQALYDVANAGAPVQRLSCLLLSARSIESLIDEWRGAASPGTTGSGDATALKLLMDANRSVTNPVLILGLDGIDEIRESNPLYGQASQLIRFFWELHRKHMFAASVPPARLLVTCRRRSDFTRFIGPIAATSDISLTPIDLGEFSPKEFEGLLLNTVNIDSGVAERLIDRTHFTLGTSRERSPFSANNAAVIDPKWISLLRRPIIWRFFAKLKPAEQIQLVDGDEAPEFKIAEKYFEWFLTRTRKRHGLDEDRVNDSLRAAARASDASGGPYAFTFWKDNVMPPGLSIEQARSLYHESISAGIIDDIPPAGRVQTMISVEFPWRWQHEFF